MLNFGNKEENEGANAQGRLTVAEFNTLISAVNQHETDIAHLYQTNSVPSGFSIEYDSTNGVIQLKYTRSGTTTIISSINASDFVVGGSLTVADYVEQDGNGNEGEFLKLGFSTGDTVYIDLEAVVGAAFSALGTRVATLENKFEESTEEEIELMIANETWTPGVIYYTVED